MHTWGPGKNFDQKSFGLIFLCLHGERKQRRTPKHWQTACSQHFSGGFVYLGNHLSWLLPQKQFIFPEVRNPAKIHCKDGNSWFLLKVFLFPFQAWFLKQPQRLLGYVFSSNTHKELIDPLPARRKSPQSVYVQRLLPSLPEVRTTGALLSGSTVILSFGQLHPWRVHELTLVLS